MSEREYRADAVAALQTLSPKMRETMAGYRTTIGWSAETVHVGTGTLAALARRGLIRGSVEDWSGGGLFGAAYTDLGRTVADMIRAERTTPRSGL